MNDGWPIASPSCARPTSLLTYCSNIHPGESWQAVRSNVETHALEVKTRLSPDEPFPLGLRVSAQAAAELDRTGTAQFADWCEKTGLFVATINGFPYGDFHGSPVKTGVYLPDWRSPERVEYTLALGKLLDGWTGGSQAVPAPSISTVPVAYRDGFTDPDWALVRNNLIDCLQGLDRLRQASGRSLVLAFEGEPGCVVETMSDAATCLERLDLPSGLADLVGVCLDCCHQAVEFEDPATALATVRERGLRLAKVQVSSALSATTEELEALRAFDEPVYLHQAVARDSDGRLERFADLPALFARLDGGRPAPEECRVHFHVPVYAAHLGYCGTTQGFLEAIIPLLDPGVLLEVETYSWGVLPADLREGKVVDCIVRELEWVTRLLNA